MNKDKLTVCNVLGVDVVVSDVHQIVAYIVDNIDLLRGQYVCATNSHTIVLAHEDEAYNIVQNEAAFVLPDGMPVSLIQRMKGYNNSQKISGPDLMEKLLKTDGYSHFFYGTTTETLNLLKSNLKLINSDISIAGMYAPPFRPLTQQEDEEVVAMINDCKPDFIWVGLGAPKQEIWMNKHKDEFAGIMFGVGAAFDFYSGRIKRAPLWVQKIGLEWLYRLSQDPRRLFKRYLVTNTKFIAYNLFESFSWWSGKNN